MGTTMHIDDPEDGVEIDELSYVQVLSKMENNDPFTQVKTSQLSPKMKRKFYNLQKRLTGMGETGAKYVDPEMLDGYSLYDVVTPPYDLDTLAGLYDQSAIHNSAINARAMNTVGLGYEFVETTKARRRIEKTQGDVEKLSRVRKGLQDEKERLDVG